MISMNKQVAIELFFGEFSKFEALESWFDLSEREKIRAAKFSKEKDQSAFAIVRSVLKRILSKKTGMDIQELNFEQNSYGKLSCLQIPDLHFSVSHTDEAFVLAFSTACKIGVDIESLNRELSIEKLENLVFTENELKGFRSLTDNLEKQRKFIDTWTKKEAITKCLGITLQQGMEGFELLENETVISRTLNNINIKLSLKTLEINSFLISVALNATHQMDVKVRTNYMHYSTSLLA
jgi:phosphopantetheine--protein transferase-like protein